MPRRLASGLSLDLSESRATTPVGGNLHQFSLSEHGPSWLKPYLYMFPQTRGTGEGVWGTTQYCTVFNLDLLIL